MDRCPGDLVIIDTKGRPKVGKVIAGFYDGGPVGRRLVRDGKRLLLVASNRSHPAVVFEKERWEHVGVVIHAVRQLSARCGRRPSPEG